MKEETRAQNAQLHAAVSVAGIAAAVAAIAAATAAQSGSSKDEQMAKIDMEWRLSQHWLQLNTLRQLRLWGPSVTTWPRWLAPP